MKNSLVIALLLTATIGCSNSSRVIVDTKGVDMSRYTDDLKECEVYAEQVPAGGEVAEGAARGAVVGGAVGAIFGDSQSAARGAGAGAVTGGVGGQARAEREKDDVVRNCMRGRGYKVLN